MHVPIKIQPRVFMTNCAPSIVLSHGLIRIPFFRECSGDRRSEKLREANYFLALISSRSATGKGYRHSELDEALKVLTEFPPEQVFLIPARLDECEMPREELLDLTCVDLFPDWDRGMDKLLSVIAPQAVGIAKGSECAKVEKPTGRYHYRLGLVDLDLGLTNLHSIAQGLNESQRFFHFMCPNMPSLGDAVVEIDGLSHLAIYEIPSSFIAEHRYLSVDLVSCLTKYPLAFEEGDNILYNYFAGPSDDDERFLFVSADQLYGFCGDAGRSFEEGLVHTTVGQLTAYFTNIGYHNQIRGCVMDFCKIRSKQIIGLKSRKFCDKCNSLLPDGELKSALHALLSWNY